MGVAASATARQVGITTTYRSLRSGTFENLPQRIALFAQGATASVGFSTAKWTAPSPEEAATRYGVGSPIHNALLGLMPPEGGGIGSIPVDVFPLVDGTTAAAGEIVASGTALANKDYVARIGGITSDSFTVPSGAIDLSVVLLAMYNAITAHPEMPVTLAYTYDTLVVGACQGTGDGTVTGLDVASGGQPTPGVWILTCTAEAVDGGTFKLVDPNGVTIDSAIAVGVAETDVGGLTFTVADGSEDYDIGDYFEITVPALTLVPTSKWKGASANRITIQILDSLGELLTSGTADANGVTFTITAMASGAGDPSVSSQLTAIGNVWETMVLNCLDPENTTAIDAYNTWGEGRWGTETHKPAIVFTGWTGFGDPTVVAATTIPEARKTDRTNCQLVAPGSPDLPFMVAARQLAKIVKMANDHPAAGYGGQNCAGITPGLDSEVWLGTSRQLALDQGSSTVEVIDNVVQIGDVCTFYHPSGEPALQKRYKWVTSIVKLQQVAYNLALRFGSQEWASAPLIPNGQATTEVLAKTPQDATQEAQEIIKALGLKAVISDPDACIEATTADFDDSNPDRINVDMTSILSGNTRVKDINHYWSFYTRPAA
jgi:phage tail sheath gpL-like